MHKEQDFEEIKIPKCIDMWQLSNICRCCCKEKRYLKYRKTLDIVQEDIDHNLDLLTVIRRLRAHGTCLNFLLDAKTLNKCVELSIMRPVNCIQEQSVKGFWHKDEAIGLKQERILGFYKLFHKIGLREKANKEKTRSRFE